jgi:hypothetical protein
MQLLLASLKTPESTALSLTITKEQLDTIVEAMQSQVENDVYDNDNVILLGKLLEVQAAEDAAA